MRRRDISEEIDNMISDVGLSEPFDGRDWPDWIEVRDATLPLQDGVPLLAVRLHATEADTDD